MERNRVAWYWNRLRLMGIKEIVFRFEQAVLLRCQIARLFTAQTVPRLTISSRNTFWLPSFPKDLQGCYIQGADALVEGKITLFNNQIFNFSDPIAWNMDPLSSTNAPLIFGKAIDYRNPDLVGDIKYLWELNRHLHLVPLAQAYALTSEEKYLNCIKEHLDSWLVQCPYLLGPNWCSSLELAIRLINWTFVWHYIGGMDSILFKGSEGVLLLKRLLAAIYQQVHFIVYHYSRYSSANNHRIGEAAGVFISTVTWPYWKEFSNWGKFAQNILEKECILQNAPDGVNREQSTSYQQFVLDFLIIAGLAGENSGSHFSSRYWKRIESMLVYIASLLDMRGNMPMIGDADDGYVVKLSQETDFCPYMSLLATGSILFNRYEFGLKAKKIDDKSHFLLGEQAEKGLGASRPEPVPELLQRDFPHGGYYILGDCFETEDEVKGIVDCGPLGYLSLAAHGHADALSLCLSASGKEFLIDPGTYAYHTNENWRNYFRGTSAHNTIRVDGKDQSVIGGRFMWLQKAKTRCLTWSSSKNRVFFKGVHDGYTRLKDPVTHYREVTYLKNRKLFIIIDEIDCKKEHLIEMFWHFSEGCLLELSDNVITATNQNKEINIKVDSKIKNIKIYKGNFDKPMGWVSRSFDQKFPSYSIVCEQNIMGKTRFLSTIKIK